MEPRLLWEKPADDFVYTAAVSDDLQYCVDGGVSKIVHVLDGRTGRILYDIPTGGTIWTVGVDAGSKLVFGGESSRVTVMDIETREMLLQLPVQDTVFSMMISPESLCFAHGDQCTMFGKGGTHYAWHDQPATEVVMDVVFSLLSSEEKLNEYIGYVIARHPAIVNAVLESGGQQSMLQFIVQHCNFPSVRCTGLEIVSHSRSASSTCLPTPRSVHHVCTC